MVTKTYTPSSSNSAHKEAYYEIIKTKKGDIVIEHGTIEQLGWMSRPDTTHTIKSLNLDSSVPLVMFTDSLGIGVESSLKYFKYMSDKGEEDITK